MPSLVLDANKYFFPIPYRVLAILPLVESAITTKCISPGPCSWPSRPQPKTPQSVMHSHSKCSINRDDADRAGNDRRGQQNSQRAHGRLSYHRFLVCWTVGHAGSACKCSLLTECYSEVTTVSVKKPCRFFTSVCQFD